MGWDHRISPVHGVGPFGSSGGVGPLDFSGGVGPFGSSGEVEPLDLSGGVWPLRATLGIESHAHAGYMHVYMCMQYQIATCAGSYLFVQPMKKDPYKPVLCMCYLSQLWYNYNYIVIGLAIIIIHSYLP